MPGRSLPDGWKLTTIGQVARVETGGTPSGQQPDFWNGSIRWMASGEVNQRFVEGTAESITELGLEKSNAKIFPPGTVMLAMNGQGRTRGMVATLLVEAACDQSLAAISPTAEATPLYLFHNLASRYAELRRLTGDDGRVGLNLSLIRSLPIILPPLNEQERIGEALASIDEAIAKTEAVIEATEALRKALLEDLLTRGVPGWHRAWKQAPGIGTVPACWDVVRLGDVLSRTQYGTNVSLSDMPVGIAVLRMGNLQDGEISLESVKFAELLSQERAELLLQPGDLLFNRTNSLDLVGKVSIVRTLPYPTSFASYLVRLNARPDRADPYWLNALLNWQPTQERIRRLATPGVSQANINPTNLRSLEIPLPPLAEQRRMVEVLEAVALRAGAEQALLLDLSNLKVCTADALLSGRIRLCPGGLAV